MDINCPYGANCTGAGGMGTPPKCFLAYSGDNLPSAARARFNIPGNILMHYLGKKVRAFYELYQCPSCGAKLLFIESETGFGREKKMVGPF
jgi:DNA-directed RNA polymerase subunit RPC12/RpoP